MSLCFCECFVFFICRKRSALKMTISPLPLVRTLFYRRKFTELSTRCDASLVVFMTSDWTRSSQLMYLNGRFTDGENVPTLKQKRKKKSFVCLKRQWGLALCHHTSVMDIPTKEAIETELKSPMNTSSATTFILTSVSFYSRQEIFTRRVWHRQSSDVILELKNRDAVSWEPMTDKQCRFSYQCSLQPSTTPFHPKLRRLQILASGGCKPEEMLKWIFK